MAWRRSLSASSWTLSVAQRWLPETERHEHRFELGIIERCGRRNINDNLVAEVLNRQADASRPGHVHYIEAVGLVVLPALEDGPGQRDLGRDPVLVVRILERRVALWIRAVISTAFHTAHCELAGIRTRASSEDVPDSSDPSLDSPIPSRSPLRRPGGGRGAPALRVRSMVIRSLQVKVQIAA